MNASSARFAPTRRHALATIAAALTASVVRAQSPAQQPAENQTPSTSANSTRTAIHYDIDFKPSPQRLYQAILDQKQFAAFTGMPATIDPTPGGAFSQFGGLIEGRNVELISNQRIVQAWRPSHWDAGIYSIVHFEFKPRGAETTLVFDHIGFPVGDYDHLDWGWHNHYWEPLKKFLV
jgi:activator of HSP90 ATPase